MNKLIIIIIIVFGMSSCSIFTSRYSEGEYISFIRILTWVEQAQDLCKNDVRVPNYMLAINKESKFLLNFAKYRDNDTEVVVIAEQISDNALEMLNRYNAKGYEGVSTSYCNGKTEILKIMSSKGARMVSGKPIE